LSLARRPGGHPVRWVSCSGRSSAGQTAAVLRPSWQSGRVQFTPTTPDGLADQLARWIGRRSDRAVIGFDGPDEIGTAALADAVAERLESTGRPTVRVSTRWWWRPASLRLEVGREEIDALLDSWIDAGALRREAIEPLAPGGSGRYLTRLRDPDTDRSLRDQRRDALPRTLLLLNGPFLATIGAPLDAVAHLQVSDATLSRRFPAERQWWIPAFDRYRADHRPAANADVVISYDHPSAPAGAGAGG